MSPTQGRGDPRETPTTLLAEILFLPSKEFKDLFLA
jgi:hypothetical protein